MHILKREISHIPQLAMLPRISERIHDPRRRYYVLDLAINPGPNVLHELPIVVYSRCRT